MKITKGPLLERFAASFDVPISEVIEWVNSYINTPSEFPQTEPTEQLRLDSIRAYIAMRLENSMTGRIRAGV